MTQIVNSAESVFSFIEATAESVDSGFRWATYDYGNCLHHHFSIFNGVGGIPIFLSAYFEATGNSRALELARGALTWAFQNEPKVGHFQRGLQLGKFGLAYSALCLSTASGRNEFPDLIENWPTTSSPKNPDLSPIFSAEKPLMAGSCCNCGRRKPTQDILKGRSGADIGWRINSLRMNWELTAWWKRPRRVLDPNPTQVWLMGFLE
jgi:hypothetical protein